MRDQPVPAAVTVNPRMCLQASRTSNRDGRAGLSPTRPSNSGTPFVPLTLLTRRSRQHATHSSAPTTRDLVNVPRSPSQRPAGGVVGRGAMPVVGDPPAPLVVRAGGL